MKNCVALRRIPILSSLIVAVILTGSASFAESEIAPSIGSGLLEIDPTIDSRAVTFEGFVVAPGGTFAEGAVVVSSAGGQVVTDADGSFRLEADVPIEAKSVQLTAVGRTGKNLVASQKIQLDPRFDRVAVGALQLSQASTCAPEWLPTFGQLPGTNDSVYALAVFDDGGGAALYVGGNFTTAGNISANRVAKWDGSRWMPLSNGMNDIVWALTVFDDGTGDALYAGGRFKAGGGGPANRIAKWDGTSWSSVGSGMNRSVRTLEVFDDGGGAALYAGGSFTVAGGTTARRLARWDGSSWSTHGAGFPRVVRALQVFDDGTGDALYIGGDFTLANKVPAPGLAKWDGTSFTSVGGGMDGIVHALTIFDSGSGPALYAGGDFTMAGGVIASHIAKWDGSNWTALITLSNGVNRPVRSLAAYDDGNGAALYIGGEFTSAGGLKARRIAKWDGSSWSAIGAKPDLGTSDNVLALNVFDDGSGPELYLGGDFDFADSARVNFCAKWNGSDWGAIGGANNPVNALKVFDDGGGPALYAGGIFTAVGDQLPANSIAKWDGSNWTKLGNGVIGAVNALEVFDDGSGDALYLGGTFQAADDFFIRQVAKWDGSTFSGLGSNPSGDVYALEVFDDGGGDALFVAGRFKVVNSILVNHIGKWDGSTWQDLNGGVTGTGNDRLLALTVFDDGGGDALYAAGVFRNAGSVAAESIAKWNGSNWAPVGAGLETIVGSICAFDDGSGQALYATGTISSARGMPAGGVVKWDGVQWSTLGSGLEGGGARSLGTFDDGSGMALYVGGSFNAIGGVAATGIAKWDGSNWTPLGGGLNDSTLAFASFDDGSGEALFVGGRFTQAIDSGDAFLAKWGCPDTEAPVIDCPHLIVAIDRIQNGPGEIVRFKVSATDDLDPAPTVVCTPPLGSLFAPGETLVKCTATDSSGNQSTCEFTVVVKRKHHHESQSDLDR